MNIYTKDFDNIWDNGGALDYFEMAKEFYKNRYDNITKYYHNVDSILCWLDAIKSEDYIGFVSNHFDYSMSRNMLLDLISGYLYGSNKLANLCCAYMEDVNWHSELNALLNDTDKFITAVYTNGYQI